VPSEQIKQAIYRATQSSGHWTQTGVAVQGESLWEFLHHRDDVLRDEHGKTIIPLLIFDQFEEIFTLPQSDDFGRKRAAEFVADLADLVENRPPAALEARMDRDDATVEQFDFTRSDYRILIALREDYLAHLEGLKDSMPSITQNRMRLARMTGEQALEAVLKPGGKLVNERRSPRIVRFVAGGPELPCNAEVEPSLLSLICRELNTCLARGATEISAGLLAGSRDTILSELLRAGAGRSARRRAQLHRRPDAHGVGLPRNLAEERVPGAFRGVRGAPPDALATLVNRRLLRIEERLDLRRVELTHDVLCTVVAASATCATSARRATRPSASSPRSASERATRRRWCARGRSPRSAPCWRRRRSSAIFGYVSMKRAQEAELKAQLTRAMLETACGEAEKLVAHILDDFYLELEPSAG
jgi:hypothetical protein